MSTISTKQGNELALETFEGELYVRTAKGAFKVESFDYVKGKVTLKGIKGGFELGSNLDKTILAGAIDRVAQLQFPEIVLLDEHAYDESLASLDGICNGLR
jgi:hypothetical protein